MKVLLKDPGEVVAVFEAGGGGDFVDGVGRSGERLRGGFHACALDVERGGDADGGMKPADERPVREAGATGQGLVGEIRDWMLPNEKQEAGEFFGILGEHVVRERTEGEMEQSRCRVVEGCGGGAILVRGDQLLRDRAERGVSGSRIGREATVGSGEARSKCSHK